MADSPLDEAPSWGEVHDVVLVGPRGAHQERVLVDLVSLRRVLDEFHELVAENDAAWGCGQVGA
jgi:hypothetical protein